MPSKRVQVNLAKSFNTTGTPVGSVPVIGSGGSFNEINADSNYLIARDVRGWDVPSIHITGTGGTNVLVDIQVTNDPYGLTGWVNAAYRAAGGGAYATTQITLAAGDDKNYFLDPADNPSWLRIKLSAGVGTVTVNAQAMGNI